MLISTSHWRAGSLNGALSMASLLTAIWVVVRQHRANVLAMFLGSKKLAVVLVLSPIVDASPVLEQWIVSTT